MPDERRLDVLRAIIEDYVATREPVGSRALVERHGLGVSPATVRNDMAALEEEGLIAQPHTSAGRIPTDLGYRLFVDRLTTVKPMSTAERRAIAHFLEGAHDLDDVVQRSVRLLVVLILSTGRVEQRLVELPVELDDDALADLRSKLNRAATGELIGTAVTQLADLVGVDRDTATPTAVVVAALIEAMSNHRSDQRVVIGGTSNLARFGDGFESTVKPILEALEEQVVLLRLLGQAASSSGVTVRIGHEGPYEELSATSVVASGYGPHERPAGALGVVGPTRMDYPGSMAAVRAVAAYVSGILEDS